ncbi:MAG: hypothetical protein NC489_17305 [Ruminococcus flavefaciens]|nr:hypothetical protein [Ruminococcus flavefaciens]
MRKRVLTFSFLIFSAAMLVFTACGNTENSLNPPTVPEPEPESESVTVEAVFEPVTEEELRQAIADLAGEGSVSPQKQEYYETLYAMDLFTEEDYLALAQVYADSGDWEGQRLMLSKLLRLYPNREYARMLSDIVIRVDAEDDGTASLISQITEILEQQDITALDNLLSSSEWQLLFPEDLAGIETRIQYRSEESVLQITADSVTTEITWRPDSERLFCCKSAATGTVFSSVTYRDGVYDGPVTVTYFDSGQNPVKSFQGSLSGDVCVGQFTLRYQGTDYSGSLDETGRTLEEQLKEVTQKGGVLYAYGPGEKTYLYKENATVEDFRIDTAYLGLTGYEEWQ